jgi:hypothetical protein
MRPYWSRDPEDEVERLADEVEALKQQGERHAEELKDRLEEQHQQQRLEAAMRADEEREQRHREESDREERAERGRQQTSHKSVVKTILEAAVCAKRGLELTDGQAAATKAMDTFLDFIAKLMAEKVFLIAEFSEFVKPMDWDDYLELKTPRPVEDEDDDDEDEPDDPLADIDRGVKNARRRFLQNMRETYPSLGGRKLTEAKRVIDFEVALPRLVVALEEMKAPEALQGKAKALAEAMKEVRGAVAAAEAADKSRREREDRLLEDKRQAKEEFVRRVDSVKKLAETGLPQNFGVASIPWFLATGLVIAWKGIPSGGVDWAGLLMLTAIAGGILFIPAFILYAVLDAIYRPLFQRYTCEICSATVKTDDLTSCGECCRIYCEPCRDVGHKSTCKHPYIWCSFKKQ